MCDIHDVIFSTVAMLTLFYATSTKKEGEGLVPMWEIVLLGVWVEGPESLYSCCVEKGRKLIDKGRL